MRIDAVMAAQRHRLVWRAKRVDKLSRKYRGTTELLYSWWRDHCGCFVVGDRRPGVSYKKKNNYIES
jgi:hypothetical protein